jgi:flavin reductase (DIM6/NTAB) family NADH-FMN oxidoreductase RutF
MAEDAERLREAMRRWTSGICIVAAIVDDARRGMTVSSFTSVSLDPPLVLVVLGEASDTARWIDGAGTFGISILAAHQKEIAETFAEPDEERRRFETGGWRLGRLGVPLLEGALATMEVRVVQTVAAGTHRIVVGHVEAVDELRLGEPLVYFNRAYAMAMRLGDRPHAAAGKG